MLVYRRKLLKRASLVMAVLAIVAAYVFPRVNVSLVRAKESILKNNLFTLRTVLHEYTFDKKRGPRTLQELIGEGYLREMPADPMTRSRDSWRIVIGQDDRGIVDVRSGSDARSTEGTLYSEW